MNEDEELRLASDHREEEESSKSPAHGPVETSGGSDASLPLAALTFVLSAKNISDVITPLLHMHISCVFAVKELRWLSHLTAQTFPTSSPVS